MTTEEKLKKLDQTKLKLDKTFGKGTINTLGDKKIEAIPVISSGNIEIDRALGVGGFPRGRIIEIVGFEASAKTSIALHTIAEAQKNGGIAAFVDAENALDISYAKNLGVDIEALWVNQPDSGEQGLDVVQNLVESGVVDIIVIDSVAALVPQAELDGEMGQAHMALQARLMSQALRKLTSIISKTNTCVVFINQYRKNIGGYGNSNVASGGNSLKFYATQRIETARTETIAKDKEDATGIKVRVKILKNKVAPPFRKVEVEIEFGKGISALSSIIDAGVREGLINKAGSWYSYGEERIGQGKDNVKEFLTENLKIKDTIEKQLRDKYFSIPEEKPSKEEAPKKRRNKTKEVEETIEIKE